MKNLAKLCPSSAWISVTVSGWGHAENKIHKQVAICQNWNEANKMLDGFGSDSSYKNVNWTYRKPYFSPSRYTCTFRPASDFTIYN